MSQNQHAYHKDLLTRSLILKTSMIEQGVEWEQSLTLDELDHQYDELKKRVQQADEADALLKPLVAGPARATLGAILAEAISAAFWSDTIMVSLIRVLPVLINEVPSSTRWRVPCCISISYSTRLSTKWASASLILQ